MADLSYRVLIIDPDQSTVRPLITHLRSSGHVARRYAKVTSALRTKKPTIYDVVILAWSNETTSKNLETLYRIQEIFSCKIYISIQPEQILDALIALEQNADGYLLRPYQTVEINHLLKRLNIIKVQSSNSVPGHAGTGELYTLSNQTSRKDQDRKLLRAFNEAALDIHKVNTREEIFHILAKHVKQLGYHFCVIKFIRSDNRFQVVQHSFELSLLQEAEKKFGISLNDFEIDMAQLEPEAKRVYYYQAIGFRANAINYIANLLNQPLMKQILEYIGFPARAIFSPLKIDGNLDSILMILGDGLGRAHRPIIYAFAQQVSAALTKASLLQTMRRRLDELTWHREVITKLSSIQETSEVLQLIVDNLTSALGKDSSASIMVFDRHMKHVQVRAIAGARPHSNLQSAPRPVGLSSHAIQRREPVFSYDIDAPSLHPEAVKDGVKIAMAIPLLEGKRIIGMIYADCLAGNKFSQDEIETAQFFAQQAIIALRDTIYIRQLLTLTEIAAQVSSEHDTRYILNLICKRTAELLDADSSLILLKMEESGETVLRVKGHWGVSDRIVRDTCDRLGTSIAGRVALTGEPIIANNIPQDDRFFNPAATEENFQAIVSVPILRGNEIIGTLDIHSKSQPDVFTEHDLHILELIARQTAVALHNSELVERLEALFDVGTQLVATLDVDESAVLQQIVQALIETLGYSVAYFRLARSDGSLAIEANAGTVRNYVDNPDYVLQPSQTSITHDVIKSQKPIQVLDVLEDSRFAFPDMIQVEGVRGMLTVPLIFEGRVIGALNCFTSQPHVFSDREVNLVVAFANLATVAAENARRIRELNATRQIAEEIAPMSNQDEILKHVALRTAELIGINTTVIINVYDPADGTFQTVEALGPRYKHALDNPPRLKGLTARAFYNDEAFIIEKASEHPDVQDSAKRDGVESIAVVPIVGQQGKPVGVLYVDVVIDIYLKNRLPLLQIIANQAGVALERSQLIKRIRQENELVRSIAKATSTLYDLQATWWEILSGAMTLTGAQYGNISQVDEAKKLLRIVVVRGEYSISQGAEIAISEESIQGWVAMHREPVLIRNVKEEEPWGNYYLDMNPHTMSELTVPIIHGDKKDLIGIINLESPNPSWFDEEDLRLLQSLAIHADIAIQNAQLYGEINNHTRQLQGILNAGENIVALRPVRDVLQAITDNLCFNLKYDVVILYPYREDLDEFEEFVKSGELNEQLTSMQKLDNRGRAEQWLMGPEIWFSSSSRHDQLLTGPFVERENIISSGYVRLMIGKEIVGILFVNCRNEHRFTKDEQNAVRLFANQAALAIHNSRQFDTLQNRLNQLEMTLAASQGIVTQKPLRETLQDILDRLVKSEGYDIVTLYPFDPIRGSFDQWLVAGQFRRFIAAAGRTKPDTTVIGKVLVYEQDEYFTPNSTDDPMLGGAFVIRENIESSGFIRLRHGKQLEGLLFVNKRHKHTFTNEDRQTVRRYAGLMAVALHEARFLNQGREQLAMLGHIGHEVSQSLDLKIVLNVLYKELRKVYGEHVTPGVLLYDELKKELNLLFTDEFSFEIDVEEEKNREIIQLDEGICGWVAQSKLPLNVSDVSNDSRYLKMLESTKSELAVPILIGDRLVGVLDIESPYFNQFDENDQRLLQTLANQVATAIANAEQFERRGRQLVAFRGSTKAIVETWGKRETLQAILEEAARLTGANFATIQELKSDCLNFEAVFPIGAKGALFSKVGSTMPINGKGITVEVARTRKPILNNNLLESQYYVDGGFKSQSELAVPLFVEGRVWGVLNVEHLQKDAFDEEDLQMMLALGELAVVALQNVERASQLSRINTVALMGAWGAEIVHDINREVGNIRLAISTLRRSSDIQPEISERLTEIDGYAGKLGLPSLPEKPPKPGEILEFRHAPLIDEVVIGVIDDAQAEYKQRWPEIAIQTSLNSADVRIAMHPYWLSRIMFHLIRNAIEAICSKNQAGYVRIITAADGNWVTINVEDTGTGIESKIESNLFITPITHSKGLGRGLLLLQYIVEAHGGRAYLKDNDIGHGSTFAVEIPRALSSNLD